MGSGTLRRAAGIGAVVLALAFVIAPRAGFAAHEPTNALARSASPYLRLHAGDPVHWREWSTDPRRAGPAPATGLIFVSVGYFACHWCHVMQRESFSDSGAAGAAQRALRLREGRPGARPRARRPAPAVRAGDARPRGMAAQRRAHPGRGSPLFGFTYLPVGDFTRLLEQIVSRWAADRDSLAGAARTVSDMLEGAGRPRAGGSDGRRRGGAALADAFTQQASETARRARRRVRPGAEVPIRAAARACCWTRSAASRSRRWRSSCASPSGSMASLGAPRTSSAGGFFPLRDRTPAGRCRTSRRCSTTTRCSPSSTSTPPMCSTSPRSSGQGWTPSRSWCASLPPADGGFYSSLSAVDADDVEGGFYLFDADDLERVLDEEERRVVAAAWGFEGASPHRARIPAGPGRGVERGGGARSRPVGRGHRGAARLGTEQAAGGARRAWAAARREAPGGMERARALGARACVDAPRRRSVRAADPCPSRAFLTEELWDGSTLVRARTVRPADNGAEEQTITPGDAAGLRLRRPWRDRVREGAR